MPQIDLPDVLHDLLSNVARVIDITPGQLASRILFGSLQQLPLHPEVHQRIADAHNAPKKPAAPRATPGTLPTQPAPPAGTINLGA